jgi:AcrR family transcriptional regulator
VDTKLRPPDTVGRIQRSALALFSRQGYERTSLREIADDLGFTKAALYYHYRSKEDLLAAVLEPLLTDLEALVAEPAGADTRLAREHFLAGYLEVLLRHRPLLRYLVNDAAAVVNSGLAPRLASIRTAVLELLGGGALSLGERMRSAAALGALQSAILVVEDGDDELEVRANALETVYRILLPPPP